VLFTILDKPSAEGCYRREDKVVPAGNSLWQSDRHGDLRYVNRRLALLLPDDILGTNWTQYIHPDDRIRTIDSYLGAVERKEPFICEHRLLTAAKDWKWVATAGRPQYEPGNPDDVVGYIGSVRVMEVPGQATPFAEVEKDWIRCRMAARSSEARPTVSFGIDGVFANNVQHMIDTFHMQGTRQFRHLTDWRLVTNRLPDMCSLCPHLPEEDRAEINEGVRRALQASEEAEQVWLNMDSFWSPDMFGKINDSMKYGEIVGYAFASRYFLQGGRGSNNDSRVQTRQWLEDHGLTALNGVLPDICRLKRTDEARKLGVEYHIDDDPQIVLEMQNAGICAYLMDMPWNRSAFSPFRVSNPVDFVESIVSAHPLPEYEGD
jgi:hypothetical protein